MIKPRLDAHADAGTAKDPAVVFHDDFEGAANLSDLPAQWDAGVFHEETIRIAEEPENLLAGKRALEFRVPKQKEEWSNSLARRVKDEKEVLFLRYYTQFERGFDQVGSSHNGATICAHYFVNGAAAPGVPADGKKANTVGKRDGRIAFWIDGKLLADFPNLRLRDVEALKIDRFALDPHIGSNTVRENKKWYDDIVAATAYIGPMVKKK